MANEKKITVPDIGGATGVDVIEIMVAVGDAIVKDTPLITLESDKASMEIPSPMAGVVHSIAIKLGDKISEGDTILTVISAASEQPSAAPKETKPNEAPPLKQVDVSSSPPPPVPAPNPETFSPTSKETNASILAGPGVRRMAREFGVDLSLVSGSSRKGRIAKEDVQRFIKSKLSENTSGKGLFISEAPSIDFSKFGDIEIKPLNKIKRLTGINVHRSWVTIPHVTQFDEADITELDVFRQENAKEAEASGYKLTILAFVTKVVAKALITFPSFNASLDASGENLIYKRYINIGVAVETVNGLVVPVIKGVPLLSVGDIAKEMARLSTKARDKGLMPMDMSGGCFTISSLGGIGGTAFTPIVNSPEVAILGLSRAAMKPIYQEKKFKPRLMLPLSLSYDHRVIDGAEAARFTRFVSEELGDIRRILL